MQIVFTIIGHTTARAAKGKGGPDDGRQADLFQFFQRHGHARFQVSRAVFFGRCGHNRCFGVFQPNPIHRFAEQFPVFCHLDGVTFCANHFDAKLRQNPHLFQRKRRVQSRLATHRRKQSVRALFFDDLGDNLGRNRLDVRCVCQFRICHNRRRVRIDEDDPIALLTQRFARLRTRIVKFAGLSDNDRTRPDDHD